MGGPNTRPKTKPRVLYRARSYLLSSVPGHTLSLRVRALKSGLLITTGGKRARMPPKSTAGAGMRVGADGAPSFEPLQTLRQPGTFPMWITVQRPLTPPRARAPTISHELVSGAQGFGGRAADTRLGEPPSKAYL